MENAAARIQSGADEGTPKKRVADISDNGDFSSSVRKKLSTSSRTGQACDRCKVRKIRCDPTPGGCSPCQQAQTNCRTTDRITGRATTRGHTDRLEDENRFLKGKIREFQDQLRNLGQVVEDVQLPAYLSESAASGASTEQGWSAGMSDSNSNDFESGILPIISKPVSPLFHPSLRMFRGRKLSLFGMQIDASAFGDPTEDLESPKSYEGLINLLFDRKPAPTQVDIPPRFEDAKLYADWFFKTLNPYFPVLHKPDIYDLLYKIYEEPSLAAYAKLSTPERVILHMLLAHIKYQFGQRNEMQEAIESSLAHFRYSLSFIPDLLRGQSLGHVQALTLIAIHTRNFQKPAAAWFCTQMAVNAAVDLGLNQSAAALTEEEVKQMSPQDIEMRKRVFWTLYGLAVGLNGRLGRPMPLRLEDINIEFPEPLPDNLPDETDLSEFRKCSFHVGIAVCKILALFGQMYGAIYPVRNVSKNYESQVAKLEEELRVWRETLPPELSDPTRADQELKIFALYIQLWDLEFQFLLHHPVVHQLNNAPDNAQNLKICLSLSTEMLMLTNQLSDAKCLDSPWINITVFLAVIFTTLFVHDQRQNEITSAELQKLRSDMALWDKIMGEVGRMLGTGSRLQTQTRRIVNHTIEGLSRQLIAKTAAAVAAEALTHSTVPADQQITTTTAAATTATTATTTTTISSTAIAATTGSYGGPSEYGASNGPGLKAVSGKNGVADSFVGTEQPNVGSQENQYPAPTPAQYTYPDPSAAGPEMGYQANVNTYANSTYAAGDRAIPMSHVAAIPIQTHSQQPSNSYGTASGTYYGIRALDSTSQPAEGAGSNEWLRWTSANLNAFPQAGQPVPQLGQQEYLNSANTLITLSGQTPPTGDDTGRQWPLNLFSMSQPGSG